MYIAHVYMYFWGSQPVVVIQHKRLLGFEHFPAIKSFLTALWKITLEEGH